jgi:hypothetical protein
MLLLLLLLVFLFGHFLAVFESAGAYVCIILEPGDYPVGLAV